MSKNERPEALAQFAESARRGERAGVTGLTATKATAPLPTDPQAKDEAATRVLGEGATGENLGAAEAVDRLPDRILKSQEGSSDEARDTPQEIPNQPYDATRDPRTGRPPQLGETQRLAREHEIDRLSDRPSAAEVESDGEVAAGESDEDDQETSENMEEEELEEPFQKPAIMASPGPEDGEAAIEELVGQGISREQAEALVEEHGPNLETLKAVAWAKDNFEPKEEEGKDE